MIFASLGVLFACFGLLHAATGPQIVQEKKSDAECLQDYSNAMDSLLSKANENTQDCLLGIRKQNDMFEDLRSENIQKSEIIETKFAECSHKTDRQEFVDCVQSVGNEHNDALETILQQGKDFSEKVLIAGHDCFTSSASFVKDETKAIYDELNKCYAK